MEQLKAEQFYQEAMVREGKPLYDAELTIELWGQECHFGIDFGEDVPGLEGNLPEIQRMLELLEECRGVVGQALLDDGMPALAEDWVSGAQLPEDYDMESDEDPEYYIVEDGQRVYMPITGEAFLASVRPEGASLYLRKKGEPPHESTFDLFLYCEPDYFAGHSIEVFVHGDGTVKVNGLAG